MFHSFRLSLSLSFTLSKFSPQDGAGTLISRDLYDGIRLATDADGVLSHSL